MKLKDKKMVGYMFGWFMVLIFGLLALFMNGVKVNYFFQPEVYFVLGTVFGLAISGFSITFVEVLTPIIKYIIAKIKKNQTSFTDILISK